MLIFSENLLGGRERAGRRHRKCSLLLMRALWLNYKRKEEFCSRKTIPNHVWCTQVDTLLLAQNGISGFQNIGWGLLLRKSNGRNLLLNSFLMKHKREFDIYLMLFSQDPQPTDAKLRIYLLYKTLLPSLSSSPIPPIKLVPSSARLYTY